MENVKCSLFYLSLFLTNMWEMCSLGFLHMHTSNARDDYIDINWSNIKEESKLNFKKFATDVAGMFDTEYDYGSILHYSKFAFARDKKIPTIKAKLELYASKMGQRKGSCPQCFHFICFASLF